MNDYLKCYNVKIHALSPIYIGSGEKIGKKEYIYMPWRQKVIIPDFDKMYQNICEKGLRQEFINYMMDNTPKGPSIGQWLQKHQLFSYLLCFPYRYFSLYGNILYTVKHQILLPQLLIKIL